MALRPSHASVEKTMMVTMLTIVNSEIQKMTTNKCSRFGQMIPG